MLTDKVIDKLEKENPIADNLRYELVENLIMNLLLQSFLTTSYQHFLIA